MIVGAAIVPTAPLLVDGISPNVPDGVEKVRESARAALAGLARADAAVILVAGDAAVHHSTRASLAGLGRPDLVADVRVADDLVQPVADAFGYPIQHPQALPLGLSVLGVLAADAVPLVSLTVPPDAPFCALADAGTKLVATLHDLDQRCVIVAAGDLSAGLTARSPLHLVSGAIFWDEQAAAAVDASRLDGLSRLGPDEAKRVGALGWAPMSVLAGVTDALKLGMVVRHYSAPRGVGYLVASG